MQPRILYPARISFKIEEEIKNFSNKQKLKEYSNTKPILKKNTESASLNKKRSKKKQDGGSHNWKTIT